MNYEEASYLDNILPPDARLINPSNLDEKIRPRYDERGLIDLQGLVDDVAASVDPRFIWPTDHLNVHHFYWPAYEYEHQRGGEVYDNPSLFRNLPIHKGLLPHAFHAWLHTSSNPPDQPDPEVMMYRNEAWMVVRGLFVMARETVLTEKRTKRRAQYVADNPHILKHEFNGRDIIGEEIMQELYETNFAGVQRYLERQENIPPAHRIIELDETPKNIATTLGRLVIPKSLNLVRTLNAA